MYANRYNAPQLARLADVKKNTHKLEGVLLALASLAEATAALSELAAQSSLQAQVRLHPSFALYEAFEPTTPTCPTSQIFAAVCSLYPTTRLLRSQRNVFEASMLALAASAPQTSNAADGSDWFGLVHLACDRPEATAHQAAGAALSSISRSYDCASGLTRYSLQTAFLGVTKSEDFHLVHSLLADLDSRNSGRQQGAAVLIGSLNFDQPSISTRAEVVIARLCNFVRRDGRTASVSVEARRNGVIALGRVLEVCLDGENPSLCAYLRLEDQIPALTHDP